MPYQPTFESLKTHPLPDWYSDAKLGIFIHWGLYSVPAFAPRGENYAEKMLAGEVGFANTPYAEWYQNSLRIPGSPTQRYHEQTYGKSFTYEQFAVLFNQALASWDPDSMADQLAGSGARYVVLVSKHHDGFLMWDSRHPSPKRPAYQTKRDVAGELTRAVSARGLKMGFYYSSLLDWTFTSRPITNTAELVAGSDIRLAYRAYVSVHWRELIERYQPWLLWSDIGYPPGKELPGLLAHYYNRQPKGVINDRWFQVPRLFYNPLGRFVLAQILKRMDTRFFPPVPHSDFITAEYGGFDGIQDQKWEACRGIGNSFGYNQFEGESDYLKVDEVIRLLADIVSKNGNLLLNVGPCPDGSLHPAQSRLLEGLGAWLKLNGEAIYDTHPWVQHKLAGSSEAELRFTTKGQALYAIVTQMPEERRLALPLEQNKTYTLLETGQRLPASSDGSYTWVVLPESFPKDVIPVIKILPAL